jgi:hypothetical protein
MYAQKEKLKHYLSKGNFELKAKVARQILELLRTKQDLTDFRIRVEYNATPQGKLLERSGDVILTLPSASFEDVRLVSSMHCAILIECLAGCQPIALLTENDSFLQLPYVYTIPVVSKYGKREAGFRESFTMPWCPIEEDGADRIAGREYSLPLERVVASVRREFPKATNLTSSIALKDSTDDSAISRLLDSADILVSNSLEIFVGLKEVPSRHPMQIDLLMVWPVIVSDLPPLIIKDSSDKPVEAGSLSWWTPVDSTGFYNTSGILPSSSVFATGAGMILTMIGVDKLPDFVDTVDTVYANLKKRFSKLRLADLYG